MPLIDKHLAEVRNDYTDENNYTAIDIWETEDDDEEGVKVAIVCRDTGKVYFIDQMYHDHPQVLEAIKEVKDSLTN